MNAPLGPLDTPLSTGVPRHPFLAWTLLSEAPRKHNGYPAIMARALEDMEYQSGEHREAT
jgi:hypothetical protein